MQLGEYIRCKWKKIVFAGGCLLLLGMAEMALVPYVMDRWSHDRRIGILHILLGVCLSAAGIIGLILFYRREYIRHGRKWKEELARLLAGYLLVQCIAGLGTGTAGALLYQACGLSYENTKTALYFMNAVWQNLFRAGLAYYMVKRLHGRDWREDWRESWKKRRKEKARGTAFMCAGAAVLAGLMFLPDNLVWRAFTVLFAVLYLLTFAVYGSYKEKTVTGGKQDEDV